MGGRLTYPRTMDPNSVTGVGPDTLVPLLLRYAARFHAAIPPGHHIASPLGAWVLLALVGTASMRGSDERTEIEEALGCDVAAAAAYASVLLTSPHPDVAAAAASWVDPSVATPALTDWRASLPAAVGTGPVPSQAVADAWTREHTLGLIKQFPLDLETEPPLFVLSTALATKVEWHEPLVVTGSFDLGGGPFADLVGHALRTPGIGTGHRAWIAPTDGHEDIGDVVVHAADAGNGLRVVSVVGVRAAPPQQVIATAGRIAAEVQPTARSLFDLELGTGPLWTITERRERVRGGLARQERVLDATLPSWSSRSVHELLGRPSLGFDGAVRAVARLLGLGGFRADAKQVAVARYHRDGFEAAAVSMMAVGASFVREAEVEAVIREAHLRFPHPYAVVAVAVDTRDPWGEPTSAGEAISPWAGLPVFSGWVAEVEEPDDQAI